MARHVRKPYVTSREADDRLVGAAYGGRKIPVKPHCPSCGRIYTGAASKAKGVHVCGYCKRRNPDLDHGPTGARRIDLGG